jgi:dolichyl-phosphate-mannose--protein O-mannosyl transferase
MPALAGVALAPVFYLLARRVLPTRRAALLAALLLLCDGVYLVQSRIAMTNIFAVLFQVTAAYFVVRSVREERLPPGAMTAAGLFLGLALSTRWTSLWAAGFLGLVLLVVRGRRLARPRELALAALAFGALPLAVYVLSYVPWMAQGNAIGNLPAYTKAIWRYHADLRAEHPYFSAWYTWPLLARPTWYFFRQVEETIRGVVAIGNPALWWASVPATLWALVTGLRHRDPRRVFCGAGFLCLYLPWGIAPRTLNYSHYLFEAIPYACLSLGLILERGWEGRAAPLAKGYVGAVVLLFFFFLPFLAALPVPASWYYFTVFDRVRPWTWFPSWV